MKKTLSILFCIAMFTAVQSVFAQDMATRAKPYQNLAVWYGTQSTPAAFEKAQWALDDINAYRASKGLAELPESILDSNVQATTSGKTITPVSWHVIRPRVIFRRAFR